MVGLGTGEITFSTHGETGRANELDHTARVFVVDDDVAQVFLTQRALRAEGYAVETFDAPEALLARLSANDRGCALVGLSTRSSSGLYVQRALAKSGVHLPLIFASDRADAASVVAAMKGGAIDVLVRPIEPRELIAAVAHAQRRDAEIALERSARVLARARWDELSPREREVCRLFARGMLNKQIAAALGTAEGTVQAQRARALRKLRIGTAGELIRLMARLGDEG